MAAEPHHPHEDPYVSQEEDYNESAPLNLSNINNALASRSLSPTKLLKMHSLFSSRSYTQFDVLGAWKRVGIALMPSFITTGSATTPSKRGIAALDGLRGLACLFAFNEHYVICYQSRETQVWLMRVPYIRLLWYGKAAVFLFFVISGYVLSCKPLRLIRSKSYLDFQKSISSSFLRRGVRLYLPCLIVSFITCLLTSMGFFDRASKVYHSYKEFVFLKEEPPPHATLNELLFGYMINVDFVFSATIPFDKDTDVLHYFVFDDHQWTIPKEFRSSVAVFALLVTTSRMRTVFRMVTVAGLAIYCIYTYRLYTSLFFAGMFCAEFDLIRQEYYTHYNETLPAHPGEKGSAYQVQLMHLPDILYKLMWWVLFTLGVLMISSPQEIQQTPNYLPTLLASWGIERVEDTLLIMGSILVVWSTATCASIGPIFNNAFVTYLGKISYALYLVHGTVIKSLGYSVLPWTLRTATQTPDDVELALAWWETVPDLQKVLAYFLGLCFVVPVCFWLSDLFWRFVDVPCVNFARTMENWVTKSDSDNIKQAIG